MSDTDINKKYKGVATLFNTIELKSFLKTYLLFLFTLEILILFFCFLCVLKPISMAFPWKAYFLAAFVVPIAITFLLGIIVTTFNIYIFGNDPKNDADNPPSDKNGLKKDTLHKIKESLQVIRQVPLLLSLLALCLCTFFLFKLDVIFSFMGRLGEAAMNYVVIIMGIATGAGVIFGVTWMIIHYKFQKMKMQYQYKKDVLAHLGLLVTDDNKVVHTQGDVITYVDPNDIPLADIHPENEPYIIPQMKKM